MTDGVMMRSTVRRIALGVNVDHVATLRQARGVGYPDPVRTALSAEQAGADGITVHLREDRRHIQERDVRLLMEMLSVKLNLEMAVTPEMLAIAEKYRPPNVCLVPERREELTTEGGLDLTRESQRYGDAIARLQSAGCRVSVFIEPMASQIHVAAQLGASVIELHTGSYANAEGEDIASRLAELHSAAETAVALKLQVNAGHGLHYRNVGPVLCLSGLTELNIGHSIVARAIDVGMERAVQEMLAVIDP